MTRKCPDCKKDQDDCECLEYQQLLADNAELNEIVKNIHETMESYQYVGRVDSGVAQMARELADLKASLGGAPVLWSDLSKVTPSALVYASGFKCNDKQSPLYALKETK